MTTAKKATAKKPAKRVAKKKSETEIWIEKFKKAVGKYPNSCAAGGRDFINVVLEQGRHSFEPGDICYYRGYGAPIGLYLLTDKKVPKSKQQDNCQMFHGVWITNSYMDRNTKPTQEYLEDSFLTLYLRQDTLNVTPRTKKPGVEQLEERFTQQIQKNYPFHEIELRRLMGQPIDLSVGDFVTSGDLNFPLGDYGKVAAIKQPTSRSIGTIKIEWLQDEDCSGNKRYKPHAFRRCTLDELKGLKKLTSWAKV